VASAGKVNTMGIARRLGRGLLPMSRAGMALWAWQNRDHVRNWAGFGARAVRQVGQGNRADTLAEARLRATLTTDRRTRPAAPRLAVEVQHGVAILRGRVPADVADAALDIAEETPGVQRIRNELDVTARRRNPPG
jgi:osmotically-inducible protein OsmY